MYMIYIINYKIKINKLIVYLWFSSHTLLISHNDALKFDLLECIAFVNSLYSNA